MQLVQSLFIFCFISGFPDLKIFIEKKCTVSLMNRKTRGGNHKLFFEPRLLGKKTDETKGIEKTETIDDKNSLNMVGQVIYNALDKKANTNQSNSVLDDDTRQKDKRETRNKSDISKPVRRVHIDSSLSMNEELRDKKANGNSSRGSNRNKDDLYTDDNIRDTNEINHQNGFNTSFHSSPTFNHSCFLLQLPCLPTDNLSIQSHRSEWMIMRNGEYKIVKWGAVGYARVNMDK